MQKSAHKCRQEWLGTLFIMAQNQKQHVHPSKGEWLNKLVRHSTYPYHGTLSAQPLSHVWLFATPWTMAHQASLSMEFSRQEYWSRLPFPTPRDFPNPGVEPMSLEPPALADAFFTMEYFSAIKMCYWKTQ